MLKMVLGKPWIPISLILIGLLGTWLGIFGPMPEGVAGWLHKWQTLLGTTVAGTVAVIAAYIAFQNTSRSLVHAEALEMNRRRRKHAAVRAVLPLALSQVTAYAEQSARSLDDLTSKCDRETLPIGTASESLSTPLPTETLQTLADFIEYSDSVGVEVIESTVAWIQIHDSRTRSMVQDNNDSTMTRVVVRTQIEGLIIDAASIYAGAASSFDYARRRQDHLPINLSWDAVLGALRNMRLGRRIPSNLSNY
jgi:hypothetical protein